MKCSYCQSERIIKYGIRNSKQRYKCNSCRKVFQLKYRYNACKSDTEENITSLTKEGMGIRNIARYLKISVTTVQKKILEIANKIDKPNTFQVNQNYQVDEVKTFIKTKEEGGIWIFYALELKTRKVIDFVAGRRTKQNAEKLTKKLLQLKPKTINTDKLNISKRFFQSFAVAVKKYIA